MTIYSLDVLLFLFGTSLLEGLGAGGEGDNRGWDGWMASPTRWTWVWVDSGSWWWTGRPGVLRFMGSQRVGPNRATELNWTELKGRMKGGAEATWKRLHLQQRMNGEKVPVVGQIYDKIQACCTFSSKFQGGNFLHSFKPSKSAT